MGIAYFEIEPNGPPRVVVEWVDKYRSTEVYLDYRNIASFPDRIAFQRGQMVELPDGSHLAVRLRSKGFGAYEVQAALNGRRLKTSSRQRRRREAYQAILIIAIFTFIGSFARAYDAPSASIMKGILVGASLLFFGLAYMVRNRSQGALNVAILLYGLDMLLVVLTLLEGNFAASLSLLMHIALLIPMLRAYNKLGEDDWFTVAAPVASNATNQPPKRLYIDLQLDPSARSAPISAEEVAASEKLTLAVRLFRIGSSKAEAFKLLKEVLKEHPKWAEAWYVVAYMVEKPEECEKALDRVLALDPIHPGATSLRVARNMGKAFMDEMLVPPDSSTSGESVSALQQKAADTIKAGNLTQARLLLRSAIAIDPNNADTWFVASFLPTDAAVHREVLLHALRLNPQHAMAQQALGKLGEKVYSFADLESPTWKPRAG